MRSFNRLPSALAYCLLASASVAAFAQDAFMITIRNDTSDNLLVTVYDQSTPPARVVISRRPLYGNASIAVLVGEDNSGKGHLYWSAMSLDSDMRMCGHNDNPNLNDGDTVKVYADSDCTE
jgi:hypothetical protein